MRLIKIVGFVLALFALYGCASNAQVKKIKKYEIQITEGKGYSVETKLVRAWVQDIEREGLVASNVVRLGENQSITGLTCSTDGKQIYFSLAESGLDDTGNAKIVANIRAISNGGGGITQITSGMWLDSNPSCTNDGKYIVFNSNRFQVDKPDIFRITTEKTSGISRVHSAEGASYEPSAHSADFFAFTYKPKYYGKLTDSEQIWTMGGANGYPTQLRDGSMPAISPDGTQIAFIGPDKQLWVMPITAQNPVQLTTEPINLEGKLNPYWSPDGKYIVFASDTGKDDKDEPNYDVFVISANGSGLQQLTTNGSEDILPVVSPDRKFIYFVSNRGFKEGIWRIAFPAVD